MIECTRHGTRGTLITDHSPVTSPWSPTLSDVRGHTHAWSRPSHGAHKPTRQLSAAIKSRPRYQNYCTGDLCNYPLAPKVKSLKCFGIKCILIKPPIKPQGKELEFMRVRPGQQGSEFDKKPS